MSQEVQQVSYFDLDVYGRNSTGGGALVHSGDFAISNSIVFFLTLKKGTYIYNSNLGGVLEELLFKPISDEFLIKKSNIISNEIQNRYSNLIRDVRCTINYNYNNNSRILEVQVYYVSVLTNENNILYVYGNVKRNSLGISLIDVNLTDDNLIAFVTLNQLEVNSPLTFNQTLNVYTWGNYRLNNLKEGTDTFNYIKNIVGYQD